MNSTIVVPVDLQTKRRAIGESQESFGQILGISRQQVQKYESGKFNIPTDKACEAAIRLGGLTLRYKGVDFELRVKSDPRENEVAKAHKASALEKALATSKEMRDFVTHTQQLVDFMSAIILGSDEGRQYIRRAAKEGYEAQVFLTSFLNKVAAEYPDEFAAGIAEAHAELSGTVTKTA